MAPGGVICAIASIAGLRGGGLSGTAGNSGVTITGSGSSLVINGSQSAINNFLAGTSTGTLSYINNADNPAALERLSMSVNDNGASGLGGAHPPRTDGASSPRPACERGRGGGGGCGRGAA